MQASTHKKIIMAGCGCAVLLGLVTAAGFVIAILQDPDLLRREFTVQQDTYFPPSRARAALDSLHAMDLEPLRRAPANDAYTLRPRQSGDGAVIAVEVWSDSLERGFILFGDTFPDGNVRRQRWIAAADWSAVDSLEQAALRSWDAGLTIALRTDRVLVPTQVLSATRAVLARARLADVRGDAAEADTLVRVAITIARHLQRDYRLYHVMIGARVEWEALHVLANIEEQGGRRPVSARTRAALARADTLVTATQLVYRSLITAGSLAEQSPALIAFVTNAKLPLAVRHQALLAVGEGWAFSQREQAASVEARRAALATLEDRALPEPLSTALREARRDVALPFFQRVEVAARQRVRWTSWALAR